MSLKTLKLLSAGALLACTIFISCTKEINGNSNEGQIALTFDDYNIDNWHTYIPLLDSLNIKATFYVCRYHELSPEQKQKLHVLAAHGHEIGFHTTTHPNLVNVLRTNGMAHVINDEIRKNLALMRQDGFDVKNFAYPYGSQNTQLDCALKPLFKSLRGVCGKKDWRKGLVNQSGKTQIVYGLHVDENSKVTDEDIIAAIDLAQVNHDCLVMTAHEINSPSYSFYISLRRLKLIAEEVKKRNMKFVTVDQISN